MQDRAVQNFVDCTSWDEWKLIWNCDNQKYLCDIMRCIIQIETLQCWRRIMLHWNIHECTTCLMSDCDNNEIVFVTKQFFLRSLMQLNIRQQYVGWQWSPQTIKELDAIKYSSTVCRMRMFPTNYVHDIILVILVRIFWNNMFPNASVRCIW